MRASDRLRERTVSQLGAGYAQGMLGFDTLCGRVESAYSARTVEQLRSLVGDLPSAAGLVSRLRRGLAHLVEHADDLALLTPPVVEAGRALVVGRGRCCDLALGDPTMSRCHAALRFEGGVWTVEDLGSLNGTWVNGWRVRGAQPLRPGDALRLGRADWVFAPRPCASLLPLERSSSGPLEHSGTYP